MIGAPLLAVLAIAGCGGGHKTTSTHASTAMRARVKATAHHVHRRAHRHAAHTGSVGSSAPAAGAMAPAVVHTQPSPGTTPAPPAPAAPPPPRPMAAHHAPPPPPAARPPAAGGIPQGGGGDGDADNNGGPSDGDGAI